jgi:hypothetical protein
MEATGAGDTRTVEFKLRRNEAYMLPVFLNDPKMRQKSLAGQEQRKLAKFLAEFHIPAGNADWKAGTADDLFFLTLVVPLRHYPELNKAWQAVLFKFFKSHIFLTFWRQGQLVTAFQEVRCERFILFS